MEPSKVFKQKYECGPYEHCDVCDGLFTTQEWEVRHSGHTTECLQASSVAVCRCDVSYHDQCCPNCPQDGYVKITQEDLDRAEAWAKKVSSWIDENFPPPI